MKIKMEKKKSIFLMLNSRLIYSKFMPNEKVITPTFIIMNQEYQEIGKWVQYPKRIIDVVESKDQFEL